LGIGSFCLRTVPITDAIAIKVSRLIAKRIEETSSTISASQRRRVFNCSPVVLMLIVFSLKQKGAAPATPFLYFILL
jgi:hypothetical protein